MKTNLKNIYRIKLIIYLFVFQVLLSCNSTKEIPIKKYKSQIGDTNFDIKLDNEKFKLCDTTNVYHQRNSVHYTGGTRALDSEIIKNYKYQSEFKKFSGSFFIRFAINCHNETGRFRWEIVDENFKKTNCPKALEKQIISIVRGLKGWNSVLIKSNYYDGYTFIIVTIKNGKILRS